MRSNVRSTKYVRTEVHFLSIFQKAEVIIYAPDTRVFIINACVPISHFLVFINRDEWDQITFVRVQFNLTVYFRDFVRVFNHTCYEHAEKTYIFNGFKCANTVNNRVQNPLQWIWKPLTKPHWRHNSCNGKFRTLVETIIPIIIYDTT